ncbi:MAG: Trm112 family protein [Castellaniella sp.]
MDPRLREILVCPCCKGRLKFSHDAQELLCSACRLAFPVRDGIPIMLASEARPMAPATPADIVASGG